MTHSFERLLSQHDRRGRPPNQLWELKHSPTIKFGTELAPVVKRTLFFVRQAVHRGDTITDESIQGLGHLKNVLLRLISWPRISSTLPIVDTNRTHCSLRSSTRDRTRRFDVSSARSTSLRSVNFLTWSTKACMISDPDPPANRAASTQRAEFPVIPTPPTHPQENLMPAPMTSISSPRDVSRRRLTTPATARSGSVRRKLLAVRLPSRKEAHPVPKLHANQFPYVFAN